jgi:predicted ATPase
MHDQVMFGRTIRVEMAAGGAARFTFDELCGKPLGAADYIAIAQRFHTVILTEVPAMSMAVRIPLGGI